MHVARIAARSVGGVALACCALWMPRAGLAAGAGFASGPPRQQQRPSPPQFEAAVDVIRIQVSVTDGKGDFVPGLEIADFTLLVDGVERPIVDVLEMEASRPVMIAAAGAGADAVEAGDPGGPDPGAPEAETVIPLGARRQFLLYFDLTAPTQTSFRYARSAALDFMDSMLEPDDRLGLAFYSQIGGLQMLVPFTGDHALVRERLESVPNNVSGLAVDAVGEGIPLDEVAEALGTDVSDAIEQIEQDRYALAAEDMALGIGQLAEALAVLQGRKHVLYFSTGISDDVFGSTDFVDALEDAAGALRAAATVVHTLQPDIMRGLDVHDVRNQESTRFGNTPPWRMPSAFGDRSLLGFLATETGGEAIWFRHRLRAGLTRVEELTRRYYVLAFQLRGDDPPVSAIEVKVARAGAVAGVPERLTLPSALGELSPIQRQLQVAEALELGNERSDVRMAVAGVPLAPRGAARQMAVIVQVPASELARMAAARGDDAVALEVMGLAIDGGGGVRDMFRGRALAGRIAGGDELQPFRFINVLSVPPGTYRVKLLVRESGTDRLSVRSLRFDAPEHIGAGPLVLGPMPVLPASMAPFLWGRRGGAQPGSANGPEPMPYPFVVDGNEVAPDAEPGVARGGSRDFWVAIHGLQPHPFTGAPEWSVETEIVRNDGRVIVVEGAEVVLAGRAGSDAVQLILRVPFADTLPYGTHELTVRVLDRISGLTAAATRPVIVIPG